MMSDENKVDFNILSCEMTTSSQRESNQLVKKFINKEELQFLKLLQNVT